MIHESTTSDINPAISVAIVDDHSIWRDLLSKMARQLGYHVAFTAINGIDCILRIQTVAQKNLVCIIDIEMPIMNGFETTRQIKTKYPDTRIIGLSIKNDPNTIAKMMQCGADGFIQKGATAAMFKAAILAAIQDGPDPGNHN